MARTPDEPLATATLSLVALAGCIVPFLPPFLKHTVASAWLIVFFGLCIALTFTLHIVFFALAARRTGRSPAVWAFFAVVFFPVASIVGLILFERIGHERAAVPVAKSSP
jgi:hypothetical protein